MTEAAVRDRPLFVPPADVIARTQLTAFMAFCEARTGESYPDQTAFYRFSVDQSRLFWSLFLDWSELLASGSPEPVCTDDSCEQAVFFPRLELSYTENLLRTLDAATEAGPAVIACHEGRPADVLTREELRRRVAATAASLEELGLEPGARVVAIAPNDAGAIVAGLATAAVGASFSTAAPEMGAFAIVDRFRQLAPSVLFAAFGADDDALAGRVAEVVRELPTLELIVSLDDGAVPVEIGLPSYRLSELASASVARRAWPRFDFNHPLFVLFSSGTTGPPKCIVHGAGGTLLEHAKEHRLHLDLRADDTLFFHSSTAWMMWNWQLSALACGATIVVYDGAIRAPDTLWRIVAENGVTVFGTSPPYLKLCEDAGFSPRRQLSLDRLRAVLSTGSILPDETYDWVLAEVGRLPLQSISGGTDIIGCFVLGNPNLPVRRGESQWRSLGLDVRALPSTDVTWPVGELICANPFPSRPVGFFGDDGSAFHDAYFAENEGVWTHGDLFEVTSHGGARLHGRSDAVLNVAGTRIGPAEIYRGLTALTEIRDAIAVEQRTEGVEGGRLVLLVVMSVPGTLDASMRARIRRELAQSASPAHVPAVIAEVRELPQTHSGKRSERAARDALNDVPVVNRSALRNPESLDELLESVLRVEARQAARRASGDETSPVAAISAIWEEALGISPIGLEENFFDLGGTSLAALRVVDAVAAKYGRELPQSALMQAPTIEAMVKLLAQTEADDFAPVIRLSRRSSGRPLFLVHGVFGEVFEFQSLVQHLEYDGPIYGVRARGLDPREQPHSRLEEMARYYVNHVQRVQPEGPYALLGFSFGGLVAFEMARYLSMSGSEVDFLGLLDADLHERCLPRHEWLTFAARKQARRLARVASAPRRRAFPYIVERAKRLVPGLTPDPSELALTPALERVQAHAMRAFRNYRPQPYDGTATLFRANVRRSEFCDALPVWSRVVRGGLTVSEVSADHMTILHEPAVAGFAATLSRILDDQEHPPAR